MALAFLGTFLHKLANANFACDMDIFNRGFSTGQVVAATGVPNPTLQSWLKRGLLIGRSQVSKIEGGGSPGLHRQFTFFSVMEVAVAKAIGDVMEAPVLSAAFRGAAAVAHIGTGPIPGRPQRFPGLPFDAPGGRTLLCLASEGAEVLFWKPGEDVYALGRSRLRGSIGFLVLEIDPIFDRVVTALGYHPKAVTDASYGRGERGEVTRAPSERTRKKIGKAVEAL